MPRSKWQPRFYTAQCAAGNREHSEYLPKLLTDVSNGSV